MLELTRTQEDRTDVNKAIRSMSFNCPGHRDRLKAHCKRVQRDYFDSGLYHRETHPAETERQREHRLVKRWAKSMEKLND